MKNQMFKAEKPYLLIITNEKQNVQGWKPQISNLW
jgi:hypothetical protein